MSKFQKSVSENVEYEQFHNDQKLNAAFLAINQHFRVFKVIVDFQRIFIFPKPNTISIFQHFRSDLKTA